MKLNYQEELLLAAIESQANSKIHCFFIYNIKTMENWPDFRRHNKIYELKKMGYIESLNKQGQYRCTKKAHDWLSGRFKQIAKVVKKCGPGIVRRDESLWSENNE